MVKLMSGTRYDIPDLTPEEQEEEFDNAIKLFTKLKTKDCVNCKYMGKNLFIIILHNTTNNFLLLF